MPQRLIAIFLMCGMIYLPACRQRSTQSEVSSYDYESETWFAKLTDEQKVKYKNIDNTAAAILEKQGWLALVKDSNKKVMTVKRYQEIPKGENIEYFMFRNPDQATRGVSALKFDSDYNEKTKELKTFVYLKTFDFGEVVALTHGQSYAFTERLPNKGATTQTTLIYDANETNKQKIAEQHALNAVKINSLVENNNASVDPFFQKLLLAEVVGCFVIVGFTKLVTRIIVEGGAAVARGLRPAVTVATVTAILGVGALVISNILAAKAQATE